MTFDAKFQRRLTIFVFLLLPVTMLIVLNIYPLLQLFWISFTDFNSINWARAKFVGWRNYVDLFTFDRDLTLTMVRSLYYLAGSLVQLVLATWFAVILNQRLPGSRVFRTILFIPFVLNAVAAGLIFRNFLELNGALNNIAQLFMGPDFKFAWLDSGQGYSNFSLAAASVWRYLGFNLVVTFGALQAIPQDQYDAARLEGANNWQMFWRITFPTIKLVLLLQFMLSVVGSLEVFEVPLLITRGAGETATFAIKMVETGFQNRRAGTAAAMAVLMLVIVVIVFITTRLITRSRNRENTGGLI
ncbi:MAG: sugar ABC transporter permease [Hyphomicrobiales bacterium]|nr:MAG: sugar ABC transporter permease [Hyphomicrobiales bacterium]